MSASDPTGGPPTGNERRTDAASREIVRRIDLLREQLDLSLEAHADELEHIKEDANEQDKETQQLRRELKERPSKSVVAGMIGAAFIVQLGLNFGVVSFAVNLALSAAKEVLVTQIKTSVSEAQVALTASNKEQLEKIQKELQKPEPKKRRDRR